MLSPEISINHSQQRNITPEIKNPGIEAGKGLFGIDAISSLKDLPWVVRSTTDIALTVARALSGIGNRIVRASLGQSPDLVPKPVQPVSSPGSVGGRV